MTNTAHAPATQARPAPRPVTVTQHTAEAVLGLTPRRYLDEVRAMRVPHCRRGKLVIVEIDDWLAALRRHREELDAVRTGADGVLAAIGRVRR